MRKHYLLLSAFAIAGCASTTGVIPVGGDVYSISHRDNGPMASLGALKAAAYKDATAYCAAKGKAVLVERSNDVPRSFGQFPETEVFFKCQ